MTVTASITRPHRLAALTHPAARGCPITEDPTLHTNQTTVKQARAAVL